MAMAESMEELHIYEGRQFIAFFGFSQAHATRLLQETGLTTRTLLMTLHFLKSYPKEDIAAQLFRASRSHYRHCVTAGVAALVALKDRVVRRATSSSLLLLLRLLDSSNYSSSSSSSTTSTTSFVGGDHS